MCSCFCILFIEYMSNNKTLTDFTNLFRILRLMMKSLKNILFDIKNG